MKKNALIVLAISFSQLIFAQNQNFIEVAVDEVVELKAKSVSFHLAVVSEYDQREIMLYGNYEDAYYYENEEDYYYEEMMSKSPKKVTKEMKQAYEQRQREYDERLAEQSLKEAQFVPFRISDLMKVLSDNSIAYIVKTDRGIFDELLYSESYENDSSLVVNLTSKEGYDNLISLISDLQVNSNTGSIIYEELNDQYETAIPKITAKATKQANLLASSMQRKIGKVIHCTNVLPTGMSSTLINDMFTNPLGRFGLSDSFDSNPFNKIQKNYITFVYRFELL